MKCSPGEKLCDNLVISQSVTFDGTNLIINLPERNYNNREKYCIVIAQAIPTTTTIVAPVFFTIGTGTTLFPLNNCSCLPITACSIQSRKKYYVQVFTTRTSGSFRLLSDFCFSPANSLSSINGTTGMTTAPTGTTGTPAAVSATTK